MEILLKILPLPVWLWLLGGLMFRSLVAWQLPTGFDEAYYYLYSRHLNWSYFDHPPVVAITTGLGWWITQVITPLTLRWGALLLYTVTLGLFYRIAERLFDRRTGILAVAIASIAPLLWIGFGVLTAPDNGLIFFWTLTLALAAAEFLPRVGRSFQSASSAAYEPSYRVALMGLTVGLACLSKYHGFVLGMGLVGFCLTSDRGRRVFTSPWLGGAIVLFLLALSPVGIWNSQHDWISFRFHLSLRFEDSPPRSYQVGDALVTWLLGIVYLFPTIGFPLWWATGRSCWQQAAFLLKPPLSGTELFVRERQALILWLSLPIALGFTLLGGKQAIYPGWPAPGFWGLTLLLAHGATHWSLRVRRRWLLGSGLAVATVSLVALLHLSLGILQKPGQYSLGGGLVPVAQDGSTALLATQQLHRQVAANPDLLKTLQEADFLFTDEFYLSAYVDMAVHFLANRPITCFSQDPRGFAFWGRPRQWVGQTAVYATLASLHPNDDPAVEFAPYFQSLEKIAEVPLTRGGTVTETVWFYQTGRMTQPYAYRYP